ncbi:MAG: DUF2878 domain-containing protein [Pseudomonadota bacterium]
MNSEQKQNMRTGAESVITLIIFKLSWLAIVFGAVWERPWLGLLAIGGFFAYEVVARGRRAVVFPALVVGALGFAVDNIYVLSGLISFSTDSVGYAPYWMALLWVNFALIVEHGLVFLHNRPLLAALLGAIGGPSAYLAGVKLGLIGLDVAPAAVLSVIALTWALAMPLMLSALRGPARRAPQVSNYASSDSSA